MIPQVDDDFKCSSSLGPSEPNAYGTFEGMRSSKIVV